MTLLMKQYKNEFFNNSTEPYRINGVKDITNKTIYGDLHFAITILDTKVFATYFFEYVKDADSGNVYVENGKWVMQNETD